MPNWDHRPPRPFGPKYVIATERESGQAIHLFHYGPYFSANTVFRKGSVQYWSKGRWGHYSNEDHNWVYNQTKYWESSPFHKDMREIIANSPEEAMDEYNKTRPN